MSDNTATRRTRTTKPAATKAVEAPKVEETVKPEGKRDFAKLLEKDATDTQQRFAAWFEANSGYKLDIKTVQFTLSTYTEFQRSAENQAALKEQREASKGKAKETNAAKLVRLEKAAKEYADLKAQLENA